MKLSLGIDTGGTYTDTVLYNSEDKTVISFAKSLTTKDNLSIGIENAVSKLDCGYFDKITCVLLSTTLATNACVEGKYGIGKLILINVSRKLFDSVAFENGLTDENDIIFVELNKDNIKNEQYIENILASITSCCINAEGVAIVQYKALHEAAIYEKFLKNKLKSKISVPIICGNELYDDLNCLKRGSSALLNVKLIPIIVNFIEAIKTSLKNLNIDAPIKIICSNATAINSSFSLSHPIETILSGPACSAIGGKELSDAENCIVVDMGGTTTDISIIENGVLKNATKGVNIGCWRTMVKGVFIDTFALGGDIHIKTKTSSYDLSNEKIIPICIAAEKYPFIKNYLYELSLQEYPHSLPLHEFFTLQKEPLNRNDFSEHELELCKALKNTALTLKQCADIMDTDIYSMDIKRLEKEGYIIRIGLTPTDIMHIKGDFEEFDRDASHFACQFYINSLNTFHEKNYTVESFCNDVYDRIEEKIYTNILRIMTKLNNINFTDEIAALCKFSWKSRNFSNGNLFNSFFKINASIVGVGAPTHLFIPEVARALQAKAIIPKYSQVANAIGAAICSNIITVNVEIEPSIENDVYVYKTLCSDEIRYSTVLEDAVETARIDAFKRLNVILEAQNEPFNGNTYIEKKNKNTSDKFGVNIYLGTVVSLTYKAFV